MLVPILFSLSGLVAITVCGVFFAHYNSYRKGKIVVDEDYNGPAQVKDASIIIIRFLVRRLNHYRKFLFQYILHIWVRFLFYVDKSFSYLYARSRNLFVDTAVKNKHTVPHFWEHLKVYKKEIDKEEEEKEEKK